ncbi:MAG: hypothetical protein KAK00_03215 [Nanoarchaeota archaeon]|nr:hypothetical protein [Nanoarchaeota archaeon]
MTDKKERENFNDFFEPDNEEERISSFGMRIRNVNKRRPEKEDLSLDELEDQRKRD